MAEKVGLYLRLSRDDEREGESMSIENQRKFLMQYVQNQHWTVHDIYTDDGFSGTNFERPGFQKLLADITSGKINVVITKDLSRLGRDQIGTAYYYQIYFPQHQVRYIAVTEGFDTAQSGASNALFPFLTAANDFYTADISRKVRTALDARKRDGKFIGSSAPIGYQKDPNEAGHLILEPTGAAIVQFIFQCYLRTGSVIGTAKELTERGIPTPSQLKGEGPAQQRFSGVWSDTMVRRILSNPTYAGHLTQNRRKKVNYKVNQCLLLPKEQWIICPNTHEPIVSQLEFDQVQDMLASRSYQPVSHPEGHLLTGLAYCADCGSPMTYVKNGPARTYMVCQGYRKGGRLQLCSSHCIREDEVLNAIRQQFQQLAWQLDQQELQTAMQKSPPGVSMERRIQQIQAHLERLSRVMERLYGDLTEGLLREEEFRTLLERNREERARLEEELAQCRAAETQQNSQRDFTQLLRQVLSFEVMDRSMVTSLLERVVIHQDKTIELYFRFRKPD